MELSLCRLGTLVLLCICFTSPTLLLNKLIKRQRPFRQLSSFTCPRVRPNTPEFFNEITNRESDSTRLNTLYSAAAGARTTTTAQEFYRDREANGKHQFIKQKQQDIGDDCVRTSVCDEDAKFRTIDGSCNNIEFPQWGMAGVALVRILPAFYTDGKQMMRKSINGAELPSARLLHTASMRTPVITDNVATYAVMSWGQLVSHDTARVMDQHRGNDVAQCLCCSTVGSELPFSIRPSNCVPISVPANDPFYSSFRVSCLNFMRSMTTDDKNCIISPSQFISDVTHYVDASFLYGSSVKVAQRLRTFSRGLLKSQVVNGAQYLPNLREGDRHCPHSEVCYDAGDDRVNQNPMLAVLQVMFLRFHNRVAAQLASLNSHWSDEILYQESRKIVIAVVQRITYTEYLAMIISPSVIEDLKLSGTPEQVFNQYDKFLNPGTFVSFTSAAFRAFHSMIPPDIQLFNEERFLVKTFNLSDVYFKPDEIQRPNMFPSFVRGLTFQPALKMNTAFAREIKELLFKSKQGLGVDLIAADIMRGRDHGLPGYNQVRLSCGLPTASDFHNLLQDMSGEVVEVLSDLYDSVDDIDLYIGAILEQAVVGSIMGPTLECLIAEQFRRWKDGDRFFYSFKNNPGAFSAAQFIEIEKMSLAKVICHVTNVEMIQPQAFKQPDLGSNALVPCNSLELMDLSPWLDSNR